jgi:hypothetical protein
VQWYLDNPKWVEGVVSGSYRDWLQKQYSWEDWLKWIFLCLAKMAN